MSNSAGFVWAKINANLPNTEKFIDAGAMARFLWMDMLLYSKLNLTDGFVSRKMINRIVSGWEIGADVEKIINSLVSARLIDKIDDISYKIHDFEDWNQTRDQVRQTAQRKGKRRPEIQKVADQQNVTRVENILTRVEKDVTRVEKKSTPPETETETETETESESESESEAESEAESNTETETTGRVCKKPKQPNWPKEAIELAEYGKGILGVLWCNVMPGEPSSKTNQMGVLCGAVSRYGLDNCKNAVLGASMNEFWKSKAQPGVVFKPDRYPEFLRGHKELTEKAQNKYRYAPGGQS